jgi:hypothetical protein
VKARVSYTLVAAAVLLAAGTAGAASTVRNPTAEERGAIRQSIFDDIAAKGSPTHPVITRVRVSTVALPAGGSRYGKFARVDLNDPKAGYPLPCLATSSPRSRAGESWISDRRK